MRILFDHAVPFFLAHGGVQIQILQTKAALEKLGIEVQFQRWWDETQTGDIIHFFGRPSSFIVELAHAKGFKVLFTDLLTAQGSRSRAAIQAHGFALRLASNLLPRTFATHLPSSAYHLADACVALTPWEACLMQNIYGAPLGKIYVVTNGVEETFFQARTVTRGPWLVCTATITERKRVLELARAAVIAETPVWIIGEPYAETDPYYRNFAQLTKQYPKLIRYEGGVADRAKLAAIYREARGFVLLSAMESLSLSALEAAACDCPLLLSDLPWARVTFDKSASYCPIISSASSTAKHLRAFYDAAPHLVVPPKPPGWIEVGKQLKVIYEMLMKT